MDRNLPFHCVPCNVSFAFQEQFYSHLLTNHPKVARSAKPTIEPNPIPILAPWELK